MKYVLTVAAGLAACANASGTTNFRFTAEGPFTLGASQSVVVFSGNASGVVIGFDWVFDYDEPVSDSSWASDILITIMAPNGNTFNIGGYDLFAPDYIPSYDGPVSDVPGTYGDSAPIPLGLLSGSGLWTVTVSNDWGGDPNPNTIANFQGVFHQVPTPGPLGLFGVAGLGVARRRR